MDSASSSGCQWCTSATPGSTGSSPANSPVTSALVRTLEVMPRELYLAMPRPTTSGLVSAVALDHFVQVGRGGQAGADVQELADALAGGEVVDHPGHEVAVGPHRGRQVGPHPGDVGGRLPVRGEVVLTAQQVVVDPGGVRDIGL